MLKPNPDGKPRADRNLTRRRAAARLSHARGRQETVNNQEIVAFAGTWPTNFTKGLPHDEFGIVDADSFRRFVAALNAATGIGTCGQPGRPVLTGTARFEVPIGPASAVKSYRPPGVTTTGVATFRTVIRKPGAAAPVPPEVRNWESPRAGHAYDLQGPDPGALAMAPAPTLGFDELTAEMAELYAMALLRDVPFHAITNGTGAVRLFDKDGVAIVPTPPNAVTVAGIVAELNKLAWFDRTKPPTPAYAHLGLGISGLTGLETRRRAARFLDSAATAPLTAGEIFRGSLPGAKVGPYVSQFLLIGNAAPAPTSDPEPPPPPPSAAGAPEPPPTRVSNPVPDAGQVRNIGPFARPFGVEAPDTALSVPGALDEPAAAAAADVSAVGCDTNGVREGYIVYGAQRIDQRVAPERPGRDHMTEWRLWLDVQNGANVRGSDAFVDPPANPPADFPKSPRFIGTPRDLGTFVHFDQLYQAYLNACILLIANEVDFDTGLPTGAFHWTRGSFATFGAPHLLSLLTEVASRALKVVRRQKFNHHLRARPEALSGVLALANDGKQSELGAPAFGRAQTTLAALKTTQLLDWVAAHNGRQNANRQANGSFPRLADENAAAPYTPSQNTLLPMEFPEGSPMHPAYGAGHAIVAGACTTIAKAFFELHAIPPGLMPDPLAAGSCPPDFAADAWWATPLTMANLPAPQASATEREKIKCVYQAPDGAADQRQLEPATAPTGTANGYKPEELTLIGELNKLAANVSIGRNMAGVHYYTDYYNSVRLGERVAVGILQEQMLQYPEPVTVRFESFDGDRVIVSTDGRGTIGGASSSTALVRVFASNNGLSFSAIPFNAWWSRDNLP